MVKKVGRSATEGREGLVKWEGRDEKEGKVRGGKRIKEETVKGEGTW